MFSAFPMHISCSSYRQRSGCIRQTMARVGAAREVCRLPISGRYNTPINSITKYGIKVIRQTLDEPLTSASVGLSSRDITSPLHSSPMKISVIYFRAGVYPKRLPNTSALSITRATKFLEHLAARPLRCSFKCRQEEGPVHIDVAGYA